ncbi:helix-turn-helix domain-containing protein [Aeromonas caviae]|uniref:helix-turn-helix domain-containing protein n=1 Tax=Aeromonas caviae TaxID=648 RepID=UPI002B48CA6F|nr:AraC family transcriptional regulator [Aeromonas caviae]
MSCLNPSYPQGHFTALHCHPHAQYCYLHDGGGIITGRGEGELLVAGQICFIPAGWEHEFRVLRRSRLSLLYVPTSARTAFGPLQASPLLAGLFARLSELVEEEVKGAYLTVLGQELERADPLAARIHLAGELDPRLLRVLDRVCQAPAIHLTLAALAADCGASVRTLNRLFLQQLGCSFRQWREQVVLGRARQLQHRGLTLAQIADRLGYEDPGALSRALQRLARREPAA